LTFGCPSNKTQSPTLIWVTARTSLATTAIQSLWCKGAETYYSGGDTTYWSS